MRGKRARRRTRIRRWLAVAVLGMTLTAALAFGGWWLLQSTVDQEVRSRIADVAERAGLDATVGPVHVDMAGTVTVERITLRGDTSTIELRGLRVRTDRWEALRTRSSAAIEHIGVSSARWVESGDPDSREVMRRVRAVAQALRSGKRRADLRTPVSPRGIPAFAIEEAVLATGRRTIARAEARGEPSGEGGLSWTATGSIDLTVFDAHERGAVSFSARGEATPDGLAAGRLQVELSEPVTLAGPRDTTVSGIRTITYAGGSIRTGPATLQDRRGRLKLMVEGIEVAIGPGGKPSEGRFDGATLVVLKNHRVTTRDLRFEAGGRRVVMTGVRVDGPRARGSAEEVVLDLRRGEAVATRVSARSDRVGGLDLSAHRIKVVADLERLLGASDRARTWPQRLELEGVVVATQHGRGSAGLVNVTLDSDAGTYRVVAERTRGTIARAVETLPVEPLRELLVRRGVGGTIATAGSRIRVHRLTASGRVMELLNGQGVGRLPATLTVQGVSARPYGRPARVAEARFVRTNGGGQITLRGEIGPADGDLVSFGLDMTLDSRLRPARGTVTASNLTPAWAPRAWADRLAIGPETRADVTLSLERPLALDPVIRARGTLALRDMSLEHWRLAPERIGPLRIATGFDVRIDRQKETVEVALDELTVGKARGSVRLLVKGFVARPYVDLWVKLPEQDCRNLVGAIPVAMRTGLKGLKVRGTAWMDARIKVPLANTRKIKLRVDGDMDQCRILTLGRPVDRKLARLKGRFVHEPVVKGTKVGVYVGSGTTTWVPYSRIPDFIKQAAMVTEDRAFMSHKGFRTSLIRGALKLNLKHLRYVYGGSTITQQLVKNLFLTRRKDIARKLEEAFVVVQMERKLSKKRILELYLNCIEYGPKIWSLKTAAQVYYGKRVAELTPTEGAYLMALKPYPRYGYYTAKRNRWTARWTRRMRLILSRVHKMGAIDADTLEAAGPTYRPTFGGFNPQTM